MASRVSAIRWGCHQIVIVTGVAGSAGDVGMPVGEQETCCAVIECRGRPVHGRVARGTIRCGECGSRRTVDRIIRLLPSRQVATRVVTIGRRNRQVVVIVCVAGSAGDVGVPIGE